jgi:hypothetical protein
MIMRDAISHRSGIRSAVTTQALVILASFISLGHFALNTPFDYSPNSTNTFPPRYAVIDLGTNVTPLNINNLGSVVYSLGTNWYLWTNGVPTLIPMTTVNGLNDSNVVAGTIPTTDTGTSGDGWPVSYVNLPASWTAAGGVAPSADYDSLFVSFPSNWSYSYWGGTPRHSESDSASVAGIDNLGHLFANYVKTYSDHYDDADFDVDLVDFIAGVGTTPIGAHEEEYNNFVSGYITNYFNATAATPSGVVLGSYITNSSSPSVSAYWDGSGIHPTGSDILVWANSAGEIIGHNTSNVVTTYRMIAPLTNTPPFDGPWNASHQIMSADQLYDPTTTPPTTNSLTSLVSPTSGWSSIFGSGTAINDSGAIVGTATYTGTATTTGSHGILLWPLPQYFIDSALTQPLDDYPATSTLLRSPKHIFAQGDNIYIRAKGPPGLGNSAVTVTVTSDSDTTGISVPLAEVSPGIYEDQSPALPLQLGTTTGTVSTGGTPSARTIKVMDKEVLKFNFNLNGITFMGSDVMVLRGKFASCGINEFYAVSTGDQTPVRTQAIANAKFFNAGDGAYDDNVVAEGNAMATFIKNVGDGSDGQATWLHVSCHGLCDGQLADQSPGLSITYTGPTGTFAGTARTHGDVIHGYGQIIQPGSIDTSGYWNKDLEWVVLAACEELNVEGGGFAAWQPLLTGSPRSIHGILGAYNDLSGNLQDQINEFWNGMESTSDPEYVIDAYGTAMEEADATAQPYAILFNQNNTYDQLKTVTRDTSPGSKFLYLNVETVIGGRADSPLDSPITEIVDNGNGLVRTAWPSVNGLKLSGAKKLFSPLDFTKTKHLAFAQKTKKSSDGKQAFLGKRFTQTLNNPTSLNKQQAADIATNYLSQQFPEFASRLKLKDVSERVSGTLSANGSASSSNNGYLVQFSVLTGGIPVWGNFVNVSIQGDHIEAVHFLCNEEGKEPTQSSIQPLDGSTSLAMALPDIKSALGIKSKYEVFKAELFYVNRPNAQGATVDLANNFIPAWRLIINKSYNGKGSVRDLHVVWIDAATGKFLGHNRY